MFEDCATVPTFMASESSKPLIFRGRNPIPAQLRMNAELFLINFVHS
jgi:hypothetical protein